jgi:molybdopterin converting factor small subunit
MVTVRYYAAARAAAGRAEEPAEAVTLGALVDDLSKIHGEGLARVLTVASFLVDGGAWRDRQALLPEGSTVDVLPPFAGG